MAIRVAHIGTGNVGRLALTGLITNPQFELTGVWVSSQAKVGKDAGELAGLDVRTDVAATNDLDTMLADKPDCAVYCAMGDNRLPQAMDDVRRILAAGIDVVGSAPVILQYPWGVLPQKYIAPLEEAARQGDSSLFINGVDPGFVTDLIPLAFAQTCQRIEQVRCMEIADYATYDGVTVMFEVMGFGKPLDEVPLLLQPGVLSMAWGCGIRQLAAGLGLELDGITDSCAREPAPEAFDIAAGTSPRAPSPRYGSRSAAWSAVGPRSSSSTSLGCGQDLRPDWPQPAQTGGSYRVEITGEPSYKVDICPSSTKGDHNHAAIVAAAGRIVNAIPALVAAPPGIRTTLDLPLITGNALFAPEQHVGAVGPNCNRF